MSTYPPIWVPGPIVREGLVEIERAVHTLAGYLEQPEFGGELGRERFRYRTPTSQHIQILKAVRIVSSLNAAARLINFGFAQEAGVVLRTVNDFLEEIAFLDEAHRGSPNASQTQFCKDFFSEADLTTEQLMQGVPKTEWVPKRKIRAALARLLSAFAKPDQTRLRTEAIDYTLNKYVHGSYSAIMELYGGSLALGGRFHMDGMAGTPRPQQFGRWFAMFLHPALNAVAGLLGDIQALDQRTKLIDIRNRLELSDEYPGRAAKERAAAAAKAAEDAQRGAAT